MQFSMTFWFLMLYLIEPMIMVVFGVSIFYKFSITIWSAALIFAVFIPIDLWLGQRYAQSRADWILQNWK